jgi:hypothetical protein
MRMASGVCVPQLLLPDAAATLLQTKKKTEKEKKGEKGHKLKPT